MKIIFLDFDGVMNTVSYQNHLAKNHLPEVDYKGRAVFDPECVNNLRKIIDATGADIVVSSDWKLIDSYKDLLEMWEERHLPGFLTDTTPNIGKKRGNEIDQWLRDCKIFCDYVILDDLSKENFNTHQLSKFIHIEPFKGITDEHVTKAIEILNHKKDKFNMKNIEDKIKGCLWGQAIGNALGILSEFMTKQIVKRRYPEGLKSYLSTGGEWDDDTNQMLCILDEIVENKEIKPKSLAKRFRYWLDTDGKGCGHLVYNVLTHQNFLEDPLKVAREIWELSNCQNAANGALMRTSVIGVLKKNWIANAEIAASITHAAPRCIGSCVITTDIIHNLIWNNKELGYEEIKDIGEKYDIRILEWINRSYLGQIEGLCLDESNSMGYTLKTLGAALWCYFHSSDFQSGLITIVNEAGDADTNAAVACSILGAKFGLSGIPAYWIENLRDKEKYEKKINTIIQSILKM